MSERTSPPTGATQAPSAAERRADPRYPCGLAGPARVLSPQRHETRWARVQDISAGGIGLLVSGPLEGGAAIVLCWDCKPVGPATLPAEVVHTAQQVDGSWRVGCRFQSARVDLTAGERRQLLRLCEFFRQPPAAPPQGGPP